MGEQEYLGRLAARALTRASEVFPVVVLMGARQTGKTTLVRRLEPFSERPYVTLDEFAVRAQAKEDPDDLVRRAPVLTLDEVQRESDLILALKRAVDEEHPRRPGRFLLTGSVNLLLMERVSDTLAGRAGYVSLWPLTRQEQLGRGTAGLWQDILETRAVSWYDLVGERTGPKEDWRDLARRGGYPTPAHELDTRSERDRWFRGYIETYLERDLQDLAAIDRLVDFRRLMKAACLRLGQLTNLSELGRDVGLPQSTVHRYVNLLETSYQLSRIEPYSVNRTKRLIKTPKTYWSDTGTALFLSGLEEPQGAHLENLVFTDLRAWRDASADRSEIMYWRTASGQEVDFVIERGEELLPIEIKTSRKVHSGETRHLKAFLEEYPDRTRGGLILYDGDEVFWAARRILAAPWWKVM